MAFQAMTAARHNERPLPDSGCVAPMAASIFDWWQWARCPHVAKLKSNGSKPIGPATAYAIVSRQKSPWNGH